MTSVDVPPPFGVVAGDIALTAVDRGIGYWATVEPYDPSSWASSVVDLGFVFYRLTTDGDDPLAVTVRVIARGLDYLNDAGRRFETVDDIRAMDPADADAVIQYGLFGKLVYVRATS